MVSRLPRSKKGLLGFLLALYALSLVLVGNNFGDRDLGRNVVMILVPTLFLGLAAVYVIRLKSREWLFVLIVAGLFALALEAAFSVYLHLSPDRAAALLWGHSDDLGGHLAYRPHHYSLYTLREGYRNAQGTRHNAQGFRDDRDLPLAKGEREFRIFFIGGSTTYTVGIKDNREIFTAKLEEALNARGGKEGRKTRFRIVNAGLGAATSAENLSRLIFQIIQFSPDLVVIQHGLNDVLPRLRGRLESDYSNYRRMWCSNKSQYGFFLKDWIYEHLLSKSRLLIFICVRLDLLEPNTIRGVTINNRYEERLENLRINGPEIFRRNTELMVVVARHSGSDVLLVSCPYNAKAGEARALAMPEHNRIMADIARQEGVPFFDLCEAFAKSEENLPDGLHVSRKGSDLKAGLYLDYLLHGYRLLERVP